MSKSHSVSTIDSQGAGTIFSTSLTTFFCALRVTTLFSCVFVAKKVLAINITSHAPAAIDKTTTIANSAPRKALIFSNWTSSPCAKTSDRLFCSVSSIPHSSGAIFRDQSGTESIDINCSRASSSFTKRTSPSDKITSFLTHKYQYPASTLKTARSDEASLIAVTAATAATFIPFLKPCDERAKPSCGDLPCLTQNKSAPTNTFSAASFASRKGASTFCRLSQKMLAAY